MNTEDRLRIGDIVGAHGVRGGVKVRSYSDSPEMVFAPQRSVWIQYPRGQWEIKTIRSAAPYKQGMVLGFEGADDRNAAEDLRGCGVWISRTELPEPDEGEYYWQDIIGISVYTVAGRFLGTVTSIFSTPAHDVYAVAQGQTELLIPAIASVIRNVDLNRKEMRVELPDGLEESESQHRPKKGSTAGREAVSD